MIRAFFKYISKNFLELIGIGIFLYFLIYAVFVDENGLFWSFLHWFLEGN